jgi:hypothetical protein
VGLAPYPHAVYVSSYLDNDIQFCLYGTGTQDGCSVAAGIPDAKNYQGQGGYAEGYRLQARFSSPNGVALINGQPDLVVADQFNNRIRRVNSATMTLVGGANQGYGPYGLNLPTSAVVLDGIVYIADTGNGLLRAIPLP